MIKMINNQTREVITTNLESYSEYDKRVWSIMETSIDKLKVIPTLVYVYSEEGEQFLVNSSSLNFCYISKSGHFIIPKKSFHYIEAQQSGLHIFKKGVKKWHN